MRLFLCSRFSFVRSPKAGTLGKGRLNSVLFRKIMEEFAVKRFKLLVFSQHFFESTIFPEIAETLESLMVGFSPQHPA